MVLMTPEQVPLLNLPTTDPQRRGPASMTRRLGEMEGSRLESGPRAGSTKPYASRVSMLGNFHLYSR